MSYASGTTVSVEKSRGEIERLLGKYKASSTGVLLEPALAKVVFKIDQWAVRFEMPLPTEEEAHKKAKGRRSWQGPTEAQKKDWIERENKRRWRCLLFAIKAKLTSVEDGIETFEEAFLAHIVVPNNQGKTAGDLLLPALRSGDPVMFNRMLPPGR